MQNCSDFEFNCVRVRTMDSTFDKNKMTFGIFRCSVMFKTRIRYLDRNLMAFKMTNFILQKKN